MKTAIIKEYTTSSILGVVQLNETAQENLKTTKNLEVTIKGQEFENVVGYKEFDDYFEVSVKSNSKTNSTSKAAFLDYLSQVIQERKSAGTDNSYTARLFEKGINKIAQKVGEEAVELVIEAKDDNKDLFLGEAADLLFHFLVLLEAKEIKLHEVIGVLQGRHGK